MDRDRFRRNRYESTTATPAKSNVHSPKHSPRHSASMVEGGPLRRENQELRERLQEDAALYRRRLDTYKQAQQNQAALVARLQSKVLQYKKKCNDLEDRMCDTIGTPSPRPIKVFFILFKFNKFAKESPASIESPKNDHR